MKKKIFLVDDSPDFCESTKLLLELHGYEADYRLRSLDLLHDLEELAEASLLISDYYVPDLNGVQLIEAVWQRFPGLPAALMTGSREESVRAAVSRLPGECAVIYKPVDFEALRELIERTTAGRSDQGGFRERPRH